MKAENIENIFVDAPVLENVSEIGNRIRNAPDPGELQTTDDFMRMSVEMMNWCGYILRVSIACVDSKAAVRGGYPKNKAIIVGHMVRLSKLYDGMLTFVASRNLDIAIIFVRMILECAMRAIYLIESPDKKEACRRFVLSSFKPEREEIQDLLKKRRSRPLIKIETRMLKSMSTWLRREGITQASLKDKRLPRALDFRSIMNRIGYRDPSYAYTFANSSHFVHGDWLDIRHHHLQKCGRYYLPNMSVRDPDPRITGPVNFVLLEALAIYLKWSQADPNDVLMPIVIELGKLNRSIDVAHENKM